MNWKNIFYPRKVAHAIKIESFALQTIIWHGYPDIMLQFLGGLGDELLLTCVAHELRRRNKEIKIWQVSSAAELLQNNPDYHRVFDMKYWTLRHSNLLNSKRMKLRYSEMPIAGEREMPPDEHILARLCRLAGVKGEIAIRPYYLQTVVEKEKGRIAGHQIAIQSIGDYTHETWMRNKLWFHDRFQKVVDQIRMEYPGTKVLQLGVEKDHLLEGVIDLRGKTTVRETAALLSNSDCFIGTQGFLTHLARAVDCRSVMIYGGREHSWQTGYICNENLDSFIECAPCWRWNQCNNDRQCMAMITTEDVLWAVENIVTKRHTELEVQTAVIQ